VLTLWTDSYGLPDERDQVAASLQHAQDGVTSPFIADPATCDWNPMRLVGLVTPCGKLPPRTAGDGWRAADRYLRPPVPPPATHAVTLSRPLCAYLLAARYTGHGSTDDARNFVCARQD
jgi:hypothetical protein